MFEMLPRFFVCTSDPCTILLHGPHGSGRTSILQKVAHDLHYDLTKKVHITYIRCSDIAGAAPVDELMAVVKEQIMGACECAPSLIVMDDIDHLFNKDPEVCHVCAAFYLFSAHPRVRCAHLLHRTRLCSQTLWTWSLLISVPTTQSPYWPPANAKKPSIPS